MRRALGTVLVVLAMGVVLSPRVARADPAEQLGLGPRPSALGGAVVAVPVGFASVHYDPAALAPGGDDDGFVETSLTLIWAHPAVWIEDLQGHPMSPAVQPDDVLSALVGARFDLGHLVGLRGVNAGLELYTPLQWIYRYTLRPDDDLKWRTLTDPLQHLSMEAGIGVRITPWLSLGASLHILFDFQGDTTGYVTRVSDTTSPTGGHVLTADADLGESVRVYGHVAPIVGVLVTPARGLRIGFTWRGALVLDEWGWARVDGSTGLGELGYIYRLDHYYRPHELELGASYRPVPTLRISADLSLELWSMALTDNHAALGPGRFGDTLVPSLGVTWTVRPGVDLMAGYRFVRAPFANLGGPTNLLDPDQHVASLGGELRLDTLAHLPFRLAVDASMRLAVLVTRTETKDWRRFTSDERLKDNPGYPGYRFGGVMPSAQIGVEAGW